MSCDCRSKRSPCHFTAVWDPVAHKSPESRDCRNVLAILDCCTSHVTTVWVMWLLCESCDYCVTTNWDLRVLWFSIAKQLDFARIWGLNPKRKFILFPKQVLPLVFLVMFPCSGGMLHLVCARDCALWTWLINPISWGMCDSFYAIMNMTVW